MLLFFAIATGWGSRNATTMEYRSAKTAARSERDLNRAEEFALKALDMKEHENDASVLTIILVILFINSNCITYLN